MDERGEGQVREIGTGAAEESVAPGTVVNVTKGRWRRTAYLRIKAGPQRDRYVHEMIMEGMLNRELLPGEQVDHEDGNTLNNRWTNLVLTTKPEHTRTENERRREKVRAMHETPTT